LSRVDLVAVPKRMSRLCIVFDLDDTLYLERDYVFSGLQAVGKWAESTLNLPDFTQSAWQLFSNGAGNATFQKTLSALGRKPEPHILSEMRHVYRTHVPEISLPPDSTFCLDAMHKIAKLGLITDGRPFAQHAKCKQLGLPGRLSQIICTGTWGTEFCKPHERAFETMEYQMGSPGDTFVYVADNPLKDFAAPLARNWLTVRVRRSAGLHAHRESLSQHRPHTELQDLWRFPNIIRDMAPGALSAQSGVNAYLAKSRSHLNEKN
jgi:putative hydrolase of the HAD superfamily